MIAEWIARNEGFNPDPVTLHNFTPVSDFVLAWSYAEFLIIKEYRNCNGSLGCSVFNSVLIEIQNNVSLNNYVTNSYAFFANRYTGSEGRRLFEGLNFRRGETYHEEYCLNTISAGHPSDFDMIKCCAFICSRIRNNLFHGAKDMRMVMEQSDLLDAATTGIKGLSVSLSVARDL